MPKVYNKRKSNIPAGATYIGRPGKFGNPFSHKDGTLASYRVKTRQEAVDAYREWVRHQAGLMHDIITELKGKDLVCWCAPEACHGDVLLEIANEPDFIFVFGSNRAGRHGSGAARDAVQQYGARYGRGEGPQGQSYAIPTKDAQVMTLPLEEIQQHVNRFLAFAGEHPELRFKVTRIGCGMAGYKDEQIVPMFENSPTNVSFFDPTWAPKVLS